MIITYAQAEDRQGLVVSVDGHLTDVDNSEFKKLHETSAWLNFARTPHEVADLEVWHGKGLVRMEFMGSEKNSTELSPIVVAVTTAELVADRNALVELATKSVEAIGR